MNKATEPLTTPHTPNQGRILTKLEVGNANPGEVRNLVGSQCQDCGFKLFPPSTVCPDCLSEKIIPLRVGTVGKLYCYTKVHIAPPSWVVPYFIGYVDFPEGLRVFGKIEITRENDLFVDMPVTVNFVESDGQWRYFFSPTN